MATVTKATGDRDSKGATVPSLHGLPSLHCVPSLPSVPLLHSGDRLTQAEFHRRYEQYPEDLPGDRQRKLAADGILRSKTFPGFWLDTAALFRPDAKRLIEVLNQGLASEEHARFIKKLEVTKNKTLRAQGPKQAAAAKTKQLREE